MKTKVTAFEWRKAVHGWQLSLFLLFRQQLSAHLILPTLVSVSPLHLPRSTTESGTTTYKISSGVLHLHHGIGRIVVLPCNWKESNISPPRPNVPSTDS
ncbi:hypothetical protein B0T13DRAFT_465770 [Neurospora crassa]|nr:hypothetical protein B0T13DRAFT_465770 [Neurospora crassa]